MRAVQACLVASMLVAAVVMASEAQAQAPEGRPMVRRRNRTCGALKQACCDACGPGIPLTECDQWTCSDGVQCYQFSDPTGRIPDGGQGYPMTCLPTPQDCGQEGRACCYSYDTSSEAQRCFPGLSCIATGIISYNSFDKYEALLKNPNRTADRSLMGACRNVTKALCGKPWMPCGGSAKALGCPNTGCGAGHYCASPGDTRLGGARCLPLPPKCGTVGNACCPGNAPGKPPSTGSGRLGALLQDVTPLSARGRFQVGARNRTSFNRTSRYTLASIPWCSEAGSTCVWAYEDYADHGLDPIPQFQGRPVPWDGVSERGYGRSNCVKVSDDCGGVGKPCCPSMDARGGGMVHNKIFKFQPCDYTAAKAEPGRPGVYCDGAWQNELLLPKTRPGVCRVNARDCGQLGKSCCVEDVSEVASVAICMPKEPPGKFYCTNRTNICTKCPAKPVTPDQMGNCMPQP